MKYVCVVSIIKDVADISNYRVFIILLSKIWHAKIVNTYLFMFLFYKIDRILLDQAQCERGERSV